jgi:phosphate transport system permease protein
VTGKLYEKTIEKLLLIAAAVAMVSVILITVFVFYNGLPVIADYGFVKFLFGDIWRPTNGNYGIFALMAGTLSVTALALLIGVPTGVAAAIFLADILHKKAAVAFKFAIELLAGIPSVVYGFFGLVVVVPLIRRSFLPLIQSFDPAVTTTGFSIFAGGLVLAIMILPTVVSLSENAISSVPAEYREASLALGANKRETATRVLVPAAKSGILASVILGMGRAIGETMAVLLITGNVAMIPKSALDPVATLTGTIAMEMSYADATHQQALFAVGIVLFCIIFILNIIARFVAGRMGTTDG